MKSIKQVANEDWLGKRVILRVDFNVPLLETEEHKLKIEEAHRIKAHRETIDYLVRAGAKVLLVSHLASGYSFRGLEEQIGEILDQTLTLVPLGELDSLPNLFKIAPLFLLENIRHDLREEKNESSLAKELAEGFDVFVNDAFAVSHRAHASVVELAKVLPAYAGLLMEAEIKNLSRILNTPALDKVVVLGGAKISTKLPVIENLLSKANKIIVGGALANNFFKAQGFGIGASVVEETAVLSFLSPPKDGSLVLPEDIVVSTKEFLKAEVGPLQNLGFTQLIVDIGPNSALRFAEIIKEAKIVVWNGPMGLAEKEAFAQGTRVVAEAVSQVPFSVVGGGDTVSLLNHWGMLDRFSFVSTGGGAMLEFLAGKKLPGLEALGY